MQRYNRFSQILMMLVTSITLSSGANASFFSRSAPLDPPNRVARLSYTKGDVSFSPVASKNNVWVIGRINRPLVTGDRIWADNNSRAELQLGSAAVRIEDETSLRIINLTDQVAQFDLSQGSLILHVRQIKAGQTYEIDTPQLAFRVTQPGDYRIDVSDKGDSTNIIVRKGSGFAYAKNAAYKINSPRAYRFVGKKLQAQIVTMRGLDSFDKWSQDRETRVAKSRSVKYVSTTMIGYEDLDSYGSWRSTPDYGYVWTPNRVPAGWAPYRYGHWSWINPWGWTWVDDQPWGFAPSHYGRWAQYRNTWVWIPGPRAAQATYAPALVVFIGGNNHRIVVNSDPAIAWFPLGPRDVYVPPYTVSETYFTNVNVSNTTINQVQITHIYNNRTTQTNYTNYQVNNAITAVPTKSFTKSESTMKTAVPVTTTVVNQAPVTTTATVTPDQTSSTGTQVTTNKPSETTLERVPVVVTAPPTSTTPVEQVSAPAETTIPLVPVVPAKPADGESHVEGTYNGGDSTTSTPVVDADKANAEAKTKVENDAAEKAEAEKKAALEKTQADKAASEKAEAEKNAAKEKAEADKAAAEKAEADNNAAKEKAEADKAAAQQAEAEKNAAREKAEADKAAAEEARAEKEAAAANAEAQRAAAEQASAAKAAAEQQAAERAEAQRAAAEQQAAERAEAQRAAAEQAAAAKAAAEQQAAERAAAEQAAKAEAEQRQAAEKAAADAAAAQAAPAPAQ